MINDISKLKDRSATYVRDFMCGCTITEKIDAHYMSVTVLTHNTISIKKANGYEIDRVDLILNSMWHKAFLDWNYLILTNHEWFANHVGYTIRFFYLPTEKPIIVEYEQGLRYIFDMVVFNGENKPLTDTLNGLKFPADYKVGHSHTQTKKKDAIEIYESNLPSILNGTCDYRDLFRSLIDQSERRQFAIGEPEGYIYRYNGRLFQDSPITDRTVTQEKTSYEYLLFDFIKYCKTHEYMNMVTTSYTNTVCALFNDYIINSEKAARTLENNIDPDGIESPYLGMKFDIGYEYIPNPITKKLCKESNLYKNVFKVLLANLRKNKHVKNCIFLNAKSVDEWNSIVKSIDIRTNVI